MNGKLLQKNYFLKNAKKARQPNNRDLHRDWMILVNMLNQHVLKQTCSFQLQVYLSVCDLLVDTRH